MCDTGYSLKRLVADLKDLRMRSAGEKDILAAVPELAKRMVLYKHNWLRPHMCEASAQRDERVGVSHVSGNAGFLSNTRRWP